MPSIPPTHGFRRESFELEDQEQASLQLLQESSSSIQKSNRHVSVVASSREEEMSGSPSRSPQSGIALEMADMINSSRSVKQITEGKESEKHQRKSKPSRSGKLRNVTKPTTAQKQYNLRSNADNVVTSQKRTIQPEYRADTYDIDTEPNLYQGFVDGEDLAQANSKDESSKLSQEGKKPKNKPTRGATSGPSTRSTKATDHLHEETFTSGERQHVEHDSAEANKKVLNLSEKEADISGIGSNSPAAGKAKASGSKLASGKTRGRPRKNREEVSLSLRQPQSIGNERYQDVIGKTNSSSPKDSPRKNRSVAKLSQKDDLGSHGKGEKASEHHSEYARREIAKARKGKSSGQEVVLGAIDMPGHAGENLERSEAGQEMTNHWEPDNDSLKSSEKGVEEEFRPEDMFENGKEINSIFDKTNELGKKVSFAMAEASSDKSLHLLIRKFQDDCSYLQQILHQICCEEETNEDDSSIQDHCSELFKDVFSLSGNYSTQQKKKRLSHEIYVIVICSMASLFHNVLSAYWTWDREEEAKSLEDFGLDIALKIADCIVSFHNKTKFSEVDDGLKDSRYVTKASIFEDIVQPLERVRKAFKTEQDRQEAHALLLQRREEAAYLEKRKARLREKRDRADARKDEWHSLHVARLAAEPDPRRFAHLRLKELVSNEDLDANGDPFERLELFAPRVQASPAVKLSQLEEQSEWTDTELAALLDGLKAFKGPSVLYDLFAKYCGPGELLRPYNVQQITRKAAYLRTILLQADLSQDKESEDWVKSIPIYE